MCTCVVEALALQLWLVPDLWCDVQMVWERAFGLMLGIFDSERQQYVVGSWVESTATAGARRCVYVCMCACVVAEAAHLESQRSTVQH